MNYFSIFKIVLFRSLLATTGVIATITSVIKQRERRWRIFIFVEILLISDPRRGYQKSEDRKFFSWPHPVIHSIGPDVELIMSTIFWDKTENTHF